MVRALEMTRRSSVRGGRRGGLLGWSTTFQWATGLDVTWGSLKTCRTLIEVTVDMDVSKFPVLEAGFVITGVVISKRHVVVATGPPDFGVGKSVLFFQGERG